MSVSIQWKVIQQYYFYQVFWKIPQSPGYSLWPQGTHCPWRALVYPYHVKVLSYEKGTVNYLTNMGSFRLDHLSFPCSTHVTLSSSPSC